MTLLIISLVMAVANAVIFFMLLRELRERQRHMADLCQALLEKTVPLVPAGPAEQQFTPASASAGDIATELARRGPQPRFRSADGWARASERAAAERAKNGGAA